MFNSPPCAGSAMIYNYSASEMWSMEGMQQKVGICPQVNLHFEALTVKENLRIFAHIKGIQRKEVDEEVGMCFSDTDFSFMASWALCVLFIKNASCSVKMRTTLI